MGCVDTPGAFRRAERVQAEKQRDNFLPIGTRRFGIEQPQMEHGMTTIIVGNGRSIGRRVEEGSGHGERRSSS